MKKINLLLFFSLCYFFTHAQISFVRTDMPSIGWVNPQQQDTVRNVVATVNFGSRGANQVYDFSALQHQVLDSVYYLALTNAQHTAVPNANLSVFIPPTTYLFAMDTTAFYAYTGLQTTLFGSPVISKYTTPDSIYKYPLVYGQNFKGNYSGSVKFLATQVNSNLSLLGWDSIKVVVTASYTDTIDGWGTVKTPVGTYNCLRQKRVEVDTTTYYYNTSNGGAYTLMPTSILGTQILPANPSIAAPATSYSYLAKETKGPVISFTYDSISEPITANWSALPPYPVANFGYTLGSAGLVTFSDSSTGSPTTYSWNYGDGSPTSGTHSPVHTYPTNGTYYVCLTVTNASGSTTFCDSVTVSGVIVTGIDKKELKAASIYPNPANDILNIEMRDNDPVNITTIELYNALGERVKMVSPKDQSSTVQISLTGLSQGIYIASLVSSDGIRSTLGRFVKLSQ